MDLMDAEMCTIVAGSCDLPYQIVRHGHGHGHELVGDIPKAEQVPGGASKIVPSLTLQAMLHQIQEADIIRT